MKRQIVITGWQSKVLTALYEEDTLCELNLEPKKSQVRVGDIYIGKVKHIVQNIQAAFVEITPGVMGYYPLKDNAVHFFVNQKKNDKIVAGDEIVVQVEKENLKTKAWFLTGRLSFPGRYTVLTKGKTGIQISARIKDTAERDRLTGIVSGEEIEIPLGVQGRQRHHHRLHPLLPDQIDHVPQLGDKQGQGRFRLMVLLRMGRHLGPVVIAVVAAEAEQHRRIARSFLSSCSPLVTVHPMRERLNSRSPSLRDALSAPFSLSSVYFDLFSSYTTPFITLSPHTPMD